MIEITNKTPLTTDGFPSGWLTVVCEQCGVSFRRRVYAVRRSKHTYCSFGCMGLAYRRRVDAPCTNCGQMIVGVQLSKVGQVCCSAACRMARRSLGDGSPKMTRAQVDRIRSGVEDWAAARGINWR